MTVQVTPPAVFRALSHQMFMFQFSTVIAVFTGMLGVFWLVAGVFGFLDHGWHSFFAYMILLSGVTSAIFWWLAVKFRRNARTLNLLLPPNQRLFWREEEPNE